MKECQQDLYVRIGEGGLKLARDRPDDARMRDTRTTLVLLAAAAIAGALFAPWYAIDLGGATRDTMAQGSQQLPGVLGEFARGLLSVLPDRIVADAWDAFEKTDIVLLCCALAAAFAALLARFDVSALAGGAAAAATLLAMLDKPGPGGDVVQLQWGPWLALAGALAIVAASRASMGGERSPRSSAPAGAFVAPAGEKPVAATVWPPADPS
jgi:hypothetical protein